MSEVTDRFRVNLPIDEAHWACREAVVALDWPLLETIEPDRLVLKKGLRFATGSLSRIEVLLTQDGPDATTITLNGKYPGAVGRLDEAVARGQCGLGRRAHANDDSLRPEPGDFHDADVRFTRLADCGDKRRGQFVFRRERPGGHAGHGLGNSTT